MKKLMFGVLFLVAMAVPMKLMAYQEANDVWVSSTCVDVVSVSSSAWTVIFSSLTDIYKSTTTTGNVNTTYSIIYYVVTNDAGSDIDVMVTDDNTKTAATCWPIRDENNFIYTSRLTKWARLKAAQAGTVNVILEKNYIRP